MGLMGLKISGIEIWNWVFRESFVFLSTAHTTDAVSATFFFSNSSHEHFAVTMCVGWGDMIADKNQN
jgi:hypothetical protein